MRDPLTGTLHRKQFFVDVEAIFTQDGFAIVLFNLDHFKRFNMHNGHVAGDELLQSVPVLLTPLFRARDFFYRFGGDEFALLMPATTLPDAMTIAEALRSRVEQSLTPPQPTHCGDPHCMGPCPPVTITGAVVSRGRHASLVAMIEASVDVLWNAKRQGRNRMCVVPD
jgi:diguanylate cyclase (GGDEF)-like protein